MNQLNFQNGLSQYRSLMSTPNKSMEFISFDWALNCAVSSAFDDHEYWYIHHPFTDTDSIYVRLIEHWIGNSNDYIRNDDFFAHSDIITKYFKVANSPEYGKFQSMMNNNFGKVNVIQLVENPYEIKDLIEAGHSNQSMIYLISNDLDFTHDLDNFLTSDNTKPIWNDRLMGENNRKV